MGAPVSYDVGAVVYKVILNLVGVLVINILMPFIIYFASSLPPKAVLCLWNLQHAAKDNNINQQEKTKGEQKTNDSELFESRVSRAVSSDSGTPSGREDTSM
jgi:hypothetical protein